MEDVMLTVKLIKIAMVISIVFMSVIFLSQSADAHCDSMSGPVVLDAKKALATGNVNIVLKWVYADQEHEVREVFRQTLRVRNINEEIRELADMYFFETLVRLHRESEGAPYTGLKPAGTDFGPAVNATEKTLDDGSPREARDLLVQALEHGVHEYFDRVHELKDFDPDDVEAGRKYVEEYVKYIHYVKPIYQAITRTAGEGSGTHHH
jgi:hypothetical protein